MGCMCNPEAQAREPQIGICIHAYCTRTPAASSQLDPEAVLIGPAQRRKASGIRDCGNGPGTPSRYFPAQLLDSPAKTRAIKARGARGIEVGRPPAYG